MHVGQDDLPPQLARRFVGPEVLIGQSTHDEQQLEAAIADPDVDYFCVGPVWETPTKQGRPGVGLRLLEIAAAAAPPGIGKPWFVTGGVSPETLDDVLATGARRVVVVRALTHATDPAPSRRNWRGASPTPIDFLNYRRSEFPSTEPAAIIFGRADPGTRTGPICQFRTRVDCCFRRWCSPRSGMANPTAAAHARTARAERDRFPSTPYMWESESCKRAIAAARSRMSAAIIGLTRDPGDRIRQLGEDCARGLGLLGVEGMYPPLACGWAAGCVVALAQRPHVLCVQVSLRLRG